AVADSIRAHWQANGPGERLLFSFHGLPQRLVDAGDPYQAQCEASTAEIVRALGLAPDEYLLAYQSRFGRERWLGPATDDTLRALAGEGVREVDVVCPGFAADCLETLEEIAMENASLFVEAGGRAMRYIPCLNDAPAHAAALAALAQRELAGWNRAGRCASSTAISRWAASTACARARPGSRGCWPCTAGSTTPPASCRWPDTWTASNWSRSTCPGMAAARTCRRAPTTPSPAPCMRYSTSPMRWTGSGSRCSGIRWARASPACSPPPAPGG